MMPSNDIIAKLYGENRYNFKTVLEKNMPDVYLEICNEKNLNCRTDKFTERVYQYLYPEKSKCALCGDTSHYISFSKGYTECCSKKCGLVFNSRKKYGTDNPFQSDIVKDKLKYTNIEKYGNKVPNKNPIQVKKIKNTKNERYGSENYNNTSKAQETCVTRYGVTNPNKLESVREKIEKTCVDRYGVKNYTNAEKRRLTCVSKYGVENAMQVNEIFTKQAASSFKLKDYIFPSGRIEKCQGFEPFAIDRLLSLKVDENDIILDKKNLPAIFYLYNGKMSRYYLDLLIKNENKIIEVKSEWTYKLHEKRNIAKKAECIKQGFKFEFWIFNNKKELTIL